MFSTIFFSIFIGTFSGSIDKSIHSICFTCLFCLVTIGEIMAHKRSFSCFNESFKACICSICFLIIFSFVLCCFSISAHIFWVLNCSFCHWLAILTIVSSFLKLRSILFDSYMILCLYRFIIMKIQLSSGGTQVPPYPPPGGLRRVFATSVCGERSEPYVVV